MDKQLPLHENTLPIHRKIYDIARMEMYELDLQIKELNPECELVGIKTDCLEYNNRTNEPTTTTEWGGIKKCDVPLIKLCTINQESKLRTDRYELTNNQWNNITWDIQNGYKNEEGLIMDIDLKSYVGKSCLFIGMAGSGKSKILQEAQRILSKNEAVRQFITACPTHKACTIVNGITLHRLFGVNPIDYSYEYKKN